MGEQKGIIVIAEDSAYARPDIQKMFFERKGYSVKLYEDGRALRDAIENGLDYDLAIVDRSLPGVSGDDIIELSKKLHPEIPVICVSGYQFFKDDKVVRKADWCFRKGGVSYSPEKLEEIVDGFFEKKRQKNVGS